MKVAYLIAAHAHAGLLNTLLGQLLADERCDVYLHIDAKSRDLPKQVRAHPRLSVLEQRHAVYWGDISQIDATLGLLAAAWESGRDYDYFCYGSGQDLHVRGGLVDHLAAHAGRSFMTWLPDRPAGRNGFTDMRWPDGLKRNYRGAHPLRMLRAAIIRMVWLGLSPRRNPRRLPEGHRLYMGSAWFILHRAAVRYLVQDNPHRDALRAYFAESLMPEERYFQTVLLNSPLASTLINDNLLYVVFAGNSPKDLTMADVPAIDASGKFIARKFHPGVDAAVIEHYAGKASGR